MARAEIKLSADSHRVEIVRERRTDVDPSPEQTARGFVALINAGRSIWTDGPYLHKRSVTEWPDGSQHVSAWRPVESEASAAGGETP